MTLHPQPPKIKRPESLNFLRLQPDRLPIHKDPFALIRLRPPPRPDPGRELVHHLLHGALQQNPRRLRNTRRHAPRHAEFDRVRKAALQVEEPLAREFRGDRGGRGFEGGAVADPNHAEDGGVAFGYADDVVY